MTPIGSTGLSAALPIDPESLIELEGLGSLDASDVAFVTGSLVEGFGNSRSDVDVFVVSSRSPCGGVQTSRAGHVIAIYRHGDFRIDYEFWREEAVLRIANALHQVRPSQEFVADKLAFSDEIFIHRVHTGQALLNAQAFDDFTARFDFALFANYLTQQSVHRIDGALEDIEGMLAVGDAASAACRARDVVGFSVDAYRHSRGNTNPLAKWRTRILDTFGDDPFANYVRETYLDLGFPLREATKDISICSAFAERCMRFSHRVTAQIQQ